MRIIGKTIAVLRKAKDMSQDDLCRAIGVSRQTVSKWESDVVQPSQDNVQALCKVLDTDEITLATDLRRKKQQEDILKAVLTRGSVIPQSPPESVTAAPVKRGRGRPRKNPIVSSPILEPQREAALTQLPVEEHYEEPIQAQPQVQQVMQPQVQQAMQPQVHIQPQVQAMQQVQPQVQAQQSMQVQPLVQVQPQPQLQQTQPQVSARGKSGTIYLAVGIIACILLVITTFLTIYVGSTVFSPNKGVLTVAKPAFTEVHFSFALTADLIVAVVVCVTMARYIYIRHKSGEGK